MDHEIEGVLLGLVRRIEKLERTADMPRWLCEVYGCLNTVYATIEEFQAHEKGPAPRVICEECKAKGHRVGEGLRPVKTAQRVAENAAGIMDAFRGQAGILGPEKAGPHLDVLYEQMEGWIGIVRYVAQMGDAMEDWILWADAHHKEYDYYTLCDACGQDAWDMMGTGVPARTLVDSNLMTIFGKSEFPGSRT